MPFEDAEGNVNFEPTDRLTRLAGRMLEAMEADPEFQHGDRVIVLLNNDDFGGIASLGYQDMAGMIADMLTQLQVMGKTRGTLIDIGFVGPDGEVELFSGRKP